MSSADSLAPSRRRAILLAASLCLNVALLALLAVGAARVMQGTAILVRPGPMSAAAIVTAWPNHAGEIAAIRARHLDALRAARRGAQRARRQVFQDFAAQPFDAAAYAAALDGVRAADARLEEEQVSVQRDVVAVLSPQERAEIAEKVRRLQRRQLWWRRNL